MSNESRPGLVHRAVDAFVAKIGRIVDSVDPLSDPKATRRTADDDRIAELADWDQGNSLRDWTTVLGNIRERLRMGRSDAVIKKLRDRI